MLGRAAINAKRADEIIKALERTRALERTKAQQAGPPMGVKEDHDKPRYDLLPPSAIHALVSVLTFGANKYAPDNWRKVEGWRWRYHAAALRHIFAWAGGERDDAESGQHHLAHAMACLAFILEMEGGGK